MDTTRKHGYGLKALLAAALATAAILAATATPPHQAFASSPDSLTAVSPQATVEEKVRVGDFEFTLYYDNGSQTAGSIFLSKYYGSATEITVPTSFVYKGKTYPQSSASEIMIGSNAFAGNAKITKVRIPGKYFSIGDKAFYGCSNLTEVTLGDGVCYIGSDAFANCPKLKTYYASGKSLQYIAQHGLGTDASGNVYSGVTVWTVQNYAIDTYCKDVNSSSSTKITIKYTADPYSKSTVTVPDAPAMPNPETPYSPGATETAVDNAIVKYSKETDPKGTVFGTLAAKITSVKKTSMKLTWSSASGAAKYVIYGNKCGKTKLVKQATVTKPGKTFKKINKKALKKGTYYKFIVVALSKANKVISTSKMVHAATTGGKVGNDKKVTTAAKKNKVSVKAGATFNLKAKATPQSKSLKVKRHRGVAYESSDTSIATVSSKGVIKGVKKGSCAVYAYAQNGVCAKVAVTVS